MWLDAPFFSILDKLAGLQSYFIGQAWFVARIIMLLAIGFAAIKYAINGEGLKDSVSKIAIAFIVFSILMYSYPRLIKGISGIVYQWSNISSYEEGGVRYMFENRKDDIAFWLERLDETSSEHSEVIKVIYDKGGRPQDLLINIFDAKHQFISPNAVVRVLMLIVEGLLSSATKYSIFNNLDKLILMIFAAIALILCGVIGSLQYFICALEFTLITSVGVIMLPFMLWDGSKFLTEKLIGAITGFFIKLLMCTITLLFTFYGYLALMTRPFDGTINEIIYFVFISIFYMMLCQAGPQLATALLTGTPQLSLMDAAKAVGTYVAAGMAGVALGKGALHTASRGALLAGGMGAEAAGARSATKQLGGGTSDQMAATAKSIGSSVAKSVASVVHSLGRSLVGPGASSGRGGAGQQQGTNRYSSLAEYRQPNAAGQSKTFREYASDRYKKGEERGLEHMVSKEQKQT